MVHGRRFVAVDLVECIDMADNKRQERAAEMKEQERAAEMRKEGAGASLAQQLQIDEDLEMSAETIEELKRQLRYEEQDKKTDEAERRFRERQRTGDPLIRKKEGGSVTFEGGAVNKSRGTGAAETGTGFQGVF